MVELVLPFSFRIQDVDTFEKTFAFSSENANVFSRELILRHQGSHNEQV